MPQRSFKHESGWRGRIGAIVLGAFQASAHRLPFSVSGL